MKMHYIRVDANDKIGIGHVMRCLSIAEELHDRGKDVTFIIADTSAQKMILERGFKTLCLYSLWNDLEREIDIMIHVIKYYQISSLLIDSYFVTELYLKIIGQYTKTIYIDDIDHFIYPVDLLVNYNIYAEDLDYQSRYQKACINARLLLGCRYIPLRKEFFLTKREVHARTSNILVTSGGTDSYDVTSYLLKEIYKQSWFEKFDYYVIIGNFNQNKIKLIEQWKQYKNMHLLVDISNIADYMKKCDIAITAGGITTYELCACGIPSIMYTLADNQLNIAKSVSDQKIIPWVGDVRHDMKGCIQRILHFIENFNGDINYLQQVSQKMKNIVDGRGCERLVDNILEI